MTVAADKKLKIAIQGYEGSFHQLAAEKYYQQNVEIVPSASFTELVNKALDPSKCDEGIMAIENSIAGSILPNYNLLEESGLAIVGEVYIQISQHLMALPGSTLDTISEVHSHPMAILQCRKFLREQPHLKVIETEDTALSAKKIRESKLKNVAAIASELAADIYNLDIVKPNIETVRNNYTRFLVLSTKRNEDWLAFNKASLLFNVAHDPGSLVKALQVISDEGVNISKIQSVPCVEKEWQYSFHTDIEFESKAQYVAVINKLSGASKNLKILGVYKNGKL